MALIPRLRYPAQVDTDLGYPQGKARNAGSFQDGTGTPLERDWINDIWGFLQALLAQAGITPTGGVDRVGASQYLDALFALSGKAQTLTTTGGSTAITLAPTTAILRINHTVADSILSITSFIGGWDGRLLRVQNVSPVHSTVQLEQNVGAPAYAGIKYNLHDIGNTAITLHEDMGASLWYDGLSARWRPLEHTRLGFL